MAESASLRLSRGGVSQPSFWAGGRRRRNVWRCRETWKSRTEEKNRKGLKRYEQKGIPVYIDGKKPEEEDWEKIFQIQEDGGFYMSDFIGLEEGQLREIHFDKVYNH